MRVVSRMTGVDDNSGGATGMSASSANPNMGMAQGAGFGAFGGPSQQQQQQQQHLLQQQQQHRLQQQQQQFQDYGQPQQGAAGGFSQQQQHHHQVRQATDGNGEKRRRSGAAARSSSAANGLAPPHQPPTTNRPQDMDRTPLAGSAQGQTSQTFRCLSTTASTAWTSTPCSPTWTRGRTSSCRRKAPAWLSAWLSA